MNKNKLKLIVSVLTLSIVLFSSCEGDEVDKISLSSIEIPSNLIVSIDKVEKLLVTALPTNTTQNIVWENSNEEVAIIDHSSNGLIVGVKGVSIGDTVLTAKSDDGSLMQSVNVEVIPPKYCDVNGSSAYNVAAVTTTGAIENINYSGVVPTNNYEYVSTESLMVSRGATFNLAVTNGNGWSRTIVWIDWNGDLELTANERLTPFSPEKFYSGDPGETYNMDITVPNDAYIGNLVVRVLSGDAWTYEDAEIPASPCGELVHSTIKDFNVEIL
ncbi:Ig-like domain-containing protein [Flavobacteriaceae bacterium]|nr:Ig-like domain-containing protein [Flavobacteriaceae bacterium]